MRFRLGSRLSTIYYMTMTKCKRNRRRGGAQTIVMIHMLPYLIHEKIVLIHIYLDTRCAAIEIQECLSTMLLVDMRQRYWQWIGSESDKHASSSDHLCGNTCRKDKAYLSRTSHSTCLCSLSSSGLLRNQEVRHKHQWNTPSLQLGGPPLWTRLSTV